MARRGKIIPFPGPRSGPRESPRESMDERGLAEVHRCDQAEALVVKSFLESEGVPTLLRSRLVSSLHPFSVGDQGEIVVLVPESELGRCRALLARLAPGPPLP